MAAQVFSGVSCGAGECRGSCHGSCSEPGCGADPVRVGRRRTGIHAPVGRAEPPSGTPGTPRPWTTRRTRWRTRRAASAPPALRGRGSQLRGHSTQRQTRREQVKREPPVYASVVTCRVGRSHRMQTMCSRSTIFTRPSSLSTKLSTVRSLRRSPRLLMKRGSSARAGARRQAATHLCTTPAAWSLASVFIGAVSNARTVSSDSGPEDAANSRSVRSPTYSMQTYMWSRSSCTHASYPLNPSHASACIPGPSAPISLTHAA